MTLFTYSRYFAGLLLSALLVSCGSDKNYTLSVDPFIGTATVGHTYPAATLPFAMVQVGPDTGISGWEYCSGYHDADSSIMGFSHTHLSGTGCPDMGDIMIMPVVGDTGFDVGPASNTDAGYRSRFKHSTEVAKPGYYAVDLDDYDIKAEMTVSPRVGFHRYTYPASDKSGVIVDLGHGIGDSNIESGIKVIDDRTIAGFRRSTGFVNDHVYYFCAQFSKPFETIDSWCDSLSSDKGDVSGKICKMRLGFKTADSEPVQVKVALSTASEHGAQKNMEQEIPHWDFDKQVKQADQIWNKALSQIDIDPVDNNQQVSFYTSLYHSLLMPNLITDVDGAYTGWDKQSHISNEGDLYTNYSLWDTYRALHPFYTIIQPEQNQSFIRSMLERYDQTGMLPINEYGTNETYCMIGNHAVPVIAEAYLKGGRAFDIDKAYEAVKRISTVSHRNSDWETYEKYGYYPFDIVEVESVSRTLESAYDDYCLAQMAKALGKAEDYDHFMHRAGFYKNLLDPETRMMRGRDSNGNWRSDFDPFSLSHASTMGGDYTEGNAWQYTWHVQHDVLGLIQGIGGEDAFCAKLDSLFFLNNEMTGSGFIKDVTGLIGQYAHGNEPSHHVAYLYTLAGQPWKTQELVREVSDKFYMARRDGLCGNDDCGQMSAWYIFSTMGFYPVDPVSGEYVLGAPQLASCTLNLPDNCKLKIVAENFSKDNKYVESVDFNGHPIENHKISHDELMKGGTLTFRMTDSY